MRMCRLPGSGRRQYEYSIGWNLQNLDETGEGLEFVVYSFGNGELALIQDRPKNSYLGGLKLLYCAACGFLAGRIRFQHQHDSVGKRAKHNRLFRGTHGGSVD